MSKGKRVIVVGGGGAGLCAAIAAAEAGADKVLLLEKMPQLGGDTIISGQVISAAGTPLQEEAGIEDTPHQYLIDHLKGGRYKSDIMLAATLIQNGANAWAWLTDHGCNFPGPEGLHIQHDHTIARSVKFAPPGLIGPLKQTAEEREVEIILNTQVTDLLVTDGQVIGVKAEQDGETLHFDADRVILTTGGFGRNQAMIQTRCPALSEAVSWNAMGITGDGIIMAQAVDADVVHYPDMPLDAFRVIQSGADVMRKVLHPTYLLAQIRELGGILVSTDGRRFYDEMGRSYEMVQAAMAQGPFYFLIFDARMATPSPWLPEETFEAQWESAITDGLVAAEAPTLEELAEKLELPSDALRETVNRWNADVAAGTDTAFGRTEGLGTIEEAPFYAMRLKPAIVQTLGGLRITPDAQVLDKDGHVISGLFAAGQVTGGVHGADYIGGSALLEIAVFGAIAGTKAVNPDADPFN